MFFAILHSINVCKCTQKNIVWALDVGRFQSTSLLTGTGILSLHVVRPCSVLVHRYSTGQ
jgi:hypothetical protein